MENEINNKDNSTGFDTNEDLIKKERFSDAQDNKNSQVGSQESKKELFEEEQNDNIKEKISAEKTEDATEEAGYGEKTAEEASEKAWEEAGHSGEKAENTREEADGDSRDLRSQEVKANGDSAEYVWNSGDRNTWSDPGATYHFKPENMREYVGRGSAYYSAENGYYGGEVKTKKKKSGLKAALVVLVSALLVMALAGGTMIGYLFAKDDDKSTDKDRTHDEENNTPETIDMIKNDGSVNVTIGSTGQSNLTKSEVVELVADAVVEITTSTVQTNPYYGNYVTSGAGSGVVIAQSDEYAYIVTNYHVIDGASSASVILTDKTVIESEYLDGDVNYDIAMIRIKTDKKFPKIVCGSSDSLKVGEEVLAIGNPLGQLGGTVTDGIISALNREVTIDNIKMTLLQTSAAVNPGNSGGGLFNMAGELIGVVNAKQSAAGIEGLGFAIPIDIVYDKLVEIIENGYIHGRASLGIETEYVSDIWEARSKYSLNATGVFVTNSSNGDIKAKDLLYSINGQRVSDGSTYAAVISSLKIGEKVEVILYRAGKATTVEVEVVEYVPMGIFG